MDAFGVEGFRLENISDYIRKEIIDRMDYYIGQDNTIVESVELFKEYLLEQKENNKKNYNKYLQIMFIDTIKMLLSCIKNSINVDDSEKNLYCCLQNINDYSSLCDEVNNDPELLSSMIYICYTYCLLNYFGRVNIMSQISLDEHQWLSSISPIHNIDLFFYRDSVNIDKIVGEMQKEVDSQISKYNKSMEEVNILTLLGFIKNYSAFDNSNYIKLLFSIGIVDYSVCKYVNQCGCDDEIILDHIDLYDSYDVNDILYKLQTSDSFLKDTLFIFYSLYFEGMYSNVEIDKSLLDIVDNEKVKKKLVLH